MKYLFLAFILFFLACSNSERASAPQQDSSVEISADTLLQMIHVKSTGASVVLGTNIEEARSYERPMMRVTFDYDFSLGVHEVTCDEFNALMKTAVGLSLKCAEDSLPATNITYYDAVLFANERSKSENYDTAYTYASADFDDEKHCTSLEGLAYHPEVKAFRLPTEAEWMLVAKQNWNTKNGWVAENSDYKLHKVCSKVGSSEQVCDMVGNAMEWVNDWLGKFSDTTLSNYVGAPDGGLLGQRIVKGGSYRNAEKSIQPYSRGDVYTVTSSTRADYVGFRLAFGKIPDAIWMGSDGRANASVVIPIANSSTIHDLTGTYRAKLAFRNDLSGNLAYVDYSSGILSVTEIVDTMEVYHPEISPDGNRVAFCTGLEGVSGKSSLYVRDLNASGSNLVKLDVESAAIPRWRVRDNGDTVIVYVTDAGNNKNETAFKGSSTWQVKFVNGKFGKPQKLFEGAYHGGISEDGTLAVSGARLLRARVSGRDTVWYNREQACNASLSGDSSKRTLFLDFGGKTGREFVGRKYGTHERLLIADSVGKLVQSVEAPIGYAFDHSEWGLGAKDIVIVSLTNANGAHTKIALVNLADSSVVDLAEGEELWHPSLWVNQNVQTGNESLLDLDSAGVYLSEGYNEEQAFFRIKMEKFWKNLETTEVALVGSSRMEWGIDPDLFPEWNMLNFGVSGADANRSYYFIYNYVLNHSEKLKAIVVSLDIDCWRGHEDHLSMVINSAIGYIYDANHSFWKDELPNGFVEAVENAFPASPDLTALISARGGMLLADRSWDADGIDVLLDSVFSEKEMQYLDDNLVEMENLIKQASEKNIYVIGIIFPQAPQYKETGALGVYGLQRSIAKRKIAYLDSLAKSNRYFILMDENKMGNHDYSDKMAHNRDHLSSSGARRMTVRLDSVLKTLKW